MKNIHVLPTDKPSEFYSIDGKHKLANSTMAMDWYISSVGYKPHNIYITSDKEIKEGDWVVIPNKNIMLVITKYATESSFMIGNSKHKGSPYYIEFCRKIILTTDQDLIKDGVQAIDDNFLQWFVKNPSCEEVKLKDSKKVKEHIWDGSNNGEIIWEKEIIIPKEEPNYMVKGGSDAVFPSSNIITFNTKQETTLEEAACLVLGYAYDLWVSVHSKDQSSLIYIEVTNWCKGAKWQAERMYSEGEIHKIVESYQNTMENNPTYITYNQWFEQFKKK
jgi:hypothetical protein